MDAAPFSYGNKEKDRSTFGAVFFFLSHKGAAGLI
jgi:hypothetical protein